LGDPLLSGSRRTVARPNPFDVAIDSKLRGCDLVKLKIGDLVAGAEIRNRATVNQQKTDVTP
jgi:hypothetical protein